ncbi:hypothetical protein [Arthrobacter sp. UYCu712]|uniref:hypothetical protein n=1 Tax=Arthrobacter sp. UYCu712 TaxID=3156340 RepID=UPI0033909F4A
MTKIDHVGRDEFEELVRRFDARTYATPLNRSSVSGGMRFYGTGKLRIENEGLEVTGTAEIIGRLLASGIIDFEGEVNISGPLVVRDGGSITVGGIEFHPDGSAKFGTLTIDPSGKITTGTAEINPDGSATFGQFKIAANGDLTSEGSLDIKGPATLNNDLTVAAGKKIKLGGLTLENTGLGGGTVNFPNGSVSASTLFGMLITCVSQIEIAAPVVKITGIPSTTGVTPNVYIDGFGNLKKIN